MSESESPSVRALVVAADLHAGSVYGLLPPDFNGHEQNALPQNPVQRWLWECWTEAWDRWLPSILGNDPHALLLLGDCTEGVHHGGHEIISVEPQDHVNAAIEIVKPRAARATATYVCEGTECHTKNTEHSLAKAIGATGNPDTGKAAWDRLTLTIAGTRCVFFHHISTTSRAYLEASALSIYLGNEQLEAAKNREPIPSVMGCAHRHRYGEFRDATGMAFVSPPWQMCTRHARKVVPSARTRPGLVILDWRNRPDGALPEAHVITFRAPAATGVTL